MQPPRTRPRSTRVRRPRRLAALGAAVLVIALAPAAWSASSQDVQANSPQVAGDPSSDTTARFPTNKQNEPTIAVNPTTGLLVAGANDEQGEPACGAAPRTSGDPTDCSFVPGIGQDGVYTSSDSGSTWTNRGLVDSSAGWQASRFVSGGDPVMVYGPHYDPTTRTFSSTAYDVYYESLASDKPGAQSGNQTPGYVVVSRSTDDGLTFSGPSVVANANGHVFNDKNSMWADKTPGSPYFGRLYAAWTQFRDAAGHAEPVRTAYSTDGGRTWSTPRQLSPATNAQGKGRQGSAVRTDGRGNVYVAWEQGSQQVYAVSRDGGATYSRPQPIGPVTDLVDPIPGSNFRNDSFLSLASDPTAGSRTLYAAWVNSTRPDGSAGELVVYRTTGAGWSKVATPYSGSVSDTGVPFFQGLDVAAGGRVDVGWQTLSAHDPTTFGTGNASIDAWYAGAADGSTFSAPTKVSSQPSDPAVSAQNNLQRQFWGDYNTLVSRGGRAWFIYTDGRHGAGCPAVDAYQQQLVSSGAVLQEEEQFATGEDPKAPQDAAGTPAPPTQCPAQFGNTDAEVSVITP